MKSTMNCTFYSAEDIKWDNCIARMYSTVMIGAVIYNGTEQTFRSIHWGQGVGGDDLAYSFVLYNILCLFTQNVKQVSFNYKHTTRENTTTVITLLLSGVIIATVSYKVFVSDMHHTLQSGSWKRVKWGQAPITSLH